MANSKYTKNKIKITDALVHLPGYRKPAKKHDRRPPSRKGKKICGASHRALCRMKNRTGKFKLSTATFVTLTTGSDDLEKGFRSFAKFKRNLRDFNNKNNGKCHIAIVSRAEIGETGLIHFHLAVWGDVDVVKNKWTGMYGDMSTHSVKIWDSGGYLAYISKWRPEDDYIYGHRVSSQIGPPPLAEDKNVYVSDMINLYLRWIILKGQTDYGQPLKTCNMGKIRDILQRRVPIFNSNVHLAAFDGAMEDEFARYRAYVMSGAPKSVCDTPVEQTPPPH